MKKNPKKSKGGRPRINEGEASFNVWTTIRKRTMTRITGARGKLSSSAAIRNILDHWASMSVGDRREIARGS